MDLVVERADGVTNICEMKFTDDPFVVDKQYEAQLRHKREAFRGETKTRNAVRLSPVCANGLHHNVHSWDVASVVTGDDLFSS